MDCPGFESQEQQEILLFSKAFILAPVSPKPPHRVSLPGGKEKRQKREFDHSPSSSAKVKNEWSYPYFPPSTYLLGVGRDNCHLLISK
jgi:hypothetical protein